MPGLLKVGTFVPQKLQNNWRRLGHSWFVSFLKDRFIGDKISKGSAILPPSYQSLLTHRRLLNGGSFPMFIRHLNWPAAYFSHSNLHRGMKIRHSYIEPWMMSDEEATGLITMHECEGNLRLGVVSKYESNQLPSNNPTEDRRFVSKLLYHREAMLFGVLDGHGGDTCAHNVSQRLPDYIGTALLPPEILLKPEVKNYFSSEHFPMQLNHHRYNFCQDPVCYENLKSFFREQRRMQGRRHTVPLDSPTVAHLQKSHAHKAGFADAKEDQVFHTMTAISKAFCRLDNDLSKEALSKGGSEETDAIRLKSASSGACALVAYIKGTELIVANCGDCRAVLGIQSEEGHNAWTALQLSNDHTTGNPREVQRVLNEHPAEEASSCLTNGRLLGRLAPLRAFGDFYFKWGQRQQEEIFKEWGQTPFSGSLTPPYLTAEPELTSIQLKPSYKFLILATDGLWDMLDNQKAVEFVKDNIQRHSPDVNITCKEKMDAENLVKKYPHDLTNCASMLIREALGGEDNVSVCTSLSIPFPETRNYRDDITVIVVHFDWTNVSEE